MSLELKLLASDFFSPFPLFENWQGLRQLSWPRDGSPMQRKQRYHSSLDHSLWDCYVKSREAFFQMGEIIAGFHAQGSEWGSGDAERGGKLLSLCP